MICFLRYVISDRKRPVGPLKQFAHTCNQVKRLSAKRAWAPSGFILLMIVQRIIGVIIFTGY